MKFWDRLSLLQARSKSTVVRPEDVEQIFSQVPPLELASFHGELLNKLEELWTWDHWCVSSVITGRTQIGFRDYGLWVILQGQSFYERVLSSPRSAADAVDCELPFTRFLTGTLLGVPAVLYEEATGEPLASRQLEGPLRGTRREWSEFRSIVPDLWTKFFVTRDRRAIRRRPVPPKHWVDSAVEPLTTWLEIYGDFGYLAEQYQVISLEQKALHAIHWMESEVANGGFDQFLRNSTGILAPEALEGLLLVGAEAHHEVLESVVKQFTKSKPSRDRIERNREIDFLIKNGEYAFQAETDCYFNLPPVESVLAGFIQSRTEAFYR